MAVLGALAANPALAQSYRYVNEFGTTGSGTLDYPNDVHIDPVTRNILVTDAFNNRVVVFNSAGFYLSAFGSSGTGNGQFAYPAALTIDPATRYVVVADYSNDRVQVFNSSGGYLSQFSLGPGNNACGVAIQPGSHNILASDGYSSAVQIFNSAGTYTGSFGSASNFGYACSMAIAANGNILVADQTNTNVQIFSSAGSYLTQFGSYGIAPGQFHGPTGVAIDPSTHNLFVADRSNNRIQEFSSCGPTLISLSVLPQTQAENQSIFFSASIGNAVSPSGIVSMLSDDGSLICSAVTYGDPQAACTGLMQLGTHSVTAVYSGNGSIASGCSTSVPVTVVTNLTPTGTTLNLVGPPNGINEGYVFTLNATTTSPRPAGKTSTSVAQPSGFVTFYDGSNVLAAVPLSGNQASYSNRIGGGAHDFSAVYSGDGTFATATGTSSTSVTTPADAIYYGNFEILQGN
jgi:DNA-binding beta-propeller fold protein YncE